MFLFPISNYALKQRDAIGPFWPNELFNENTIVIRSGDNRDSATANKNLNEDNQAIGVKPSSLRLKRYADLSKSDKQEVISVPEQALPESVDQNSLETISATVEHDPVIANGTGNVENPLSDNLKLERSSHLDDTKGGFFHQIRSWQGSEIDEKEKEQSPLKPRLWFHDSSEMFDATDSSFSTSSKDWSDVSGEIADRSSSSKSGDSSSSASPETKKAGFLRRLGARLLRKHKKKQTTYGELNDSRQSTDTSSTTDDISSITFESNPINQTSSEQPQVVTGHNGVSATTETSKASSI